MNKLDETQLGSLRTLLSHLPELDDKEFAYFFRGHSDKSYSLSPSIYRNENWFSNEDKMIREIIMRCPNEFTQMKSSFEKLVKMQHYDLPTRLLDLTENPLVALYFACCGKMEEDKDGEFYFFKIPKSEIKYFDSDSVSIVSNVALTPNDFEIHKSFDGSITRFNNENNHNALKLMHEIKQEKPYFLNRINPSDIKKVFCVKPKMDNPRVVRQDGAFFLFGIKGNKHEAAEIPEGWIYRPNGKRYIIKASEKQNILKQLSSVGISKAKLFPEIDMVSQFIKNDYGLYFDEFNSNVSPSVPGPKVRRF